LIVHLGFLGFVGNIQGGWAGLGWSVDTFQIARKITNGVCSPCGSGGVYGYRNEFILTFNGAGGEMIPDQTIAGRFYTKDQSFLYIQRHNFAIGNQLDENGLTPPNVSGEWWEVVAHDGTRWRMGWNADSEQRAAMSGYPGSASGAWASLGYAGKASNVFAMRWRADQVTDTHGNQMKFTYTEDTANVWVWSSGGSALGWGPAQVQVAGVPSCNPLPSNPVQGTICGDPPVYNTLAECSQLGQVPCQMGQRYDYQTIPPGWVSSSTLYDRASYLTKVEYTSHTSGAPAPGYSIEFVLQAHNASDIPATPTHWDNWDSYQLDKINVKYGAAIVRTYDLTIGFQSGVTVLTSVIVSGPLNGGATAPT
ncbi:MAG: hypothetical protein AAB217_16100, partial [Chloroflexota bacterium]